MNRLRLCFLVAHVGQGGAEVVIANLIRRLPRSEFEVHLIAPNGQRLLRTAEEHGAITHVFPFPHFYSTSLQRGERTWFNPISTAYDLLLVTLNALRVSRILVESQIDVVHTNAIMSHLIGAFACALARCHLVWKVDDIISPKLGAGAARPLFGWIGGHFADLIVPPSNAVASSLRVGRANSQVRVVYNGVDCRRFAPDPAMGARQSLGLGSESVVIGIIGRVTPWKGHRVFLEAAKKIAEVEEKCQFLVVGDTAFDHPGYLEELRKLTEKLGLLDRVLFTGFREDVLSVMKAIDILVVPSVLPDPCPLVVLEGMACGKPVVASRIGGIPEQVEECVTGYLFEAGNVPDLAQALLELVRNSALREQFGTRARTRAEKNFSLEVFVDAMANIYRSIALEHTYTR